MHDSDIWFCCLKTIAGQKLQSELIYNILLKIIHFYRFTFIIIFIIRIESLRITACEQAVGWRGDVGGDHTAPAVAYGEEI